MCVDIIVVVVGIVVDVFSIVIVGIVVVVSKVIIKCLSKQINNFVVVDVVAIVVDVETFVVRIMI